MKIKFKKSWVYEELYKARNVKPSFSWGLISWNNIYRNRSNLI